MRRIILLMMGVIIPVVMMAQVKITGNVKDAATKEPLIGVSVVVTGTSIGTVTDFDGNFSLSIPKDKANLQFTYLGYKNLVVPAKTTASNIIEMHEDTQALDEVVVIGYGTQKKETLVGSISSIKSETLVSVPASNLTQTLAGKATGLAVVQPSGEIGRDEAKLFIRGKATFSDEASQPLIVVDGIIRESFSQIDPNEVESINILKDASATAVFGVKGANGVIIVTTKRGETGKAQVSFTSQIAMNSPMRLHKPIDGYRTAVLYNTVKNHKGEPIPYSASQLMNWRTGASPYTEPDVDWMDEIMKPYSWQQQYNINVRGGTKSVRYFISGGFFDQQSPFKEDNITKFMRYNFRSNLDIDITKDLLASVNMGARVEDRHYPTSMFYNSWEIYHGAFAQSGIRYPMYNMNGSYAPNNLFALIKDSGTAKDNRTVLELGLNVQYKMDWLLKGLAVRGQIAYDDNSNHPILYDQNPDVYDYTYPTDTYTLNKAAKPLRYNWDDVHNIRKFYWEGAVTYERDFGKHSINSLFLFNRMLDNTDTNQPRALQGWVGRVIYNYDQKYLAEFNIGVNGSENFNPDKRYGVFPAFSLGWIVSQEKFWQENPIYNVVNKLKLRSSLGWVGNDRSWVNGEEQQFLYLNQYDYKDRSANTPEGGYMFGDNKINGIRQDAIPNFDVTWENARKFNVGAEFGFFNNLLTWNIDYFHEYRWDILLESEKIPDYVGATIRPGNIGRTTNQGIETDLSFFKQVNKDFSYFVKGNFSFARNKTLERGTSEGTLLYQRPEGFPIDTPLKYITLGYFQSYEEIENSPSQLGISGNTEVNPGDLKYKDINGDGVIDRFDMIRTGYPTTPEIQYGISLGLTWKGFDVSCLFQGSAHTAFDKNWEIMWAFSNNDNVFPRHWYYWNPESGDASADYTELYGKYQNNEAGADYTLSDGSYIRLKNIDLGYTLPNHLTRKVYMNMVRFYVSALNVATWSKEKGLDPDNRNNRGGYMPPMQTLNFGVNVNF